MSITGLKSECRTRPQTTASIMRRNQAQKAEVSLDEHFKVSSLKQQLRMMKTEYEKTLTNVNRARTSLEKTNKQACLTRMGFMKLYESKKVRLEDSELEKQLKVGKAEERRNRSYKARERKISEELLHLVAKADLEHRKEQVRKRNMTQKQFRKNLLSEQKKMQELQVRAQFEKVKDDELQLQARKKKMAGLQAFRARDRYMRKLEEEMVMISSYNAVIQQVEKCDEDYVEEDQAKSASFFLTKPSE